MKKELGLLEQLSVRQSVSVPKLPNYQSEKLSTMSSPEPSEPSEPVRQ
jgi:hypothetical protein